MRKTVPEQHTAKRRGEWKFLEMRETVHEQHTGEAWEIGTVGK